MNKTILLSLSLLLSTPAHATTLYEDFGGHEVMSSVVDQFLWNLADDDRINHHFVESNVKRFRDKLFEMFCDVADGPCEYSGDDMVRVHAGMKLNDADFNAVVENLIRAMESQDIPTGPQNRLLKILAEFYTDIVTKSNT